MKKKSSGKNGKELTVRYKTNIEDTKFVYIRKDNLIPKSSAKEATSSQIQNPYNKAMRENKTKEG